MTPVVIESPYAGNVKLNLHYLDLCILDCIKRGETPYASHKMLTTALDDADEEDRSVGITAGRAMAVSIRLHGGTVAFYVDLGNSTGMRAAVRFYESAGIRYETRTLPGRLSELLLPVSIEVDG